MPLKKYAPWQQWAERVGYVRGHGGFTGEPEIDKLIKKKQRIEAEMWELQCEIEDLETKLENLEKQIDQVERLKLEADTGSGIKASDGYAVTLCIRPN